MLKTGGNSRPVGRPGWFLYDFLYNDQTGLPIDSYSDREVEAKTEVLFGHILGKYPTVPSPYYLAEAS